MTTLVAAGDSFTYGSELQDQMGGNPSKSTWSALLSRKLSMEYECIAVPGASNKKIARTLFDKIIQSTSRDMVVCVMWTFDNRFEFYNSKKDTWEDINVHAIDKNKFAEKLYDLCGDSGVQSYYNDLTSFLMVQNLLNKKKIPYLFTHADNLQFEKYSHYNVPISIRTLAVEIEWDKWHFIGEKQEGFFSWGTQNFLCGLNRHPLEDAHRELTEQMLPKALTLLKK